MENWRFTFAVLLGFGLFGATGCPDNLIADDFGISPIGCRLPQRCYLNSCPCDSRAAVFSTTTLRNDCIACDPSAGDAMGNCICNVATSTCEDPVQVCIGRGVECPGAGARCVAKSLVCAPGQGDVPQLVGTTNADGGPDEVPHCAFPDDTCCPGSENDMSASAPEDLF
jgi:hypothetical protein